ncbi:MAG TPA: bifunctional diguanylate cyclase/phosphodiesterase [Actinoplanes sp.]
MRSRAVGARLWWLFLAAGVLSTGCYFLIPPGGLAQNLTYNAIGLVSALAILAAVRLHRPERPAMWYWFGAGQITWVAGDVIYEYYQYVLEQSPYPSPADAFYLSAYPMLVLGFVLLVRGGRGRDVAGLVDAAVVATGLGLVLWLFVLHPIAADTTTSTLERVISTAYPAMDAMLLVLLARLFTGAGTRTPSARLLGVAGVLLLVADVTYSVLTLYSDYQSGVLDAGWLLSYVLWGAAALHPSMRTRGMPRAAGRTRVGWGRLVVLAMSSLLAPAMLLVPGVGADRDNRVAIALCAVVLFLLVVLRMSGFVAQVQRQAGQLEDLAMQDDLTGLANRRRFEQQLAAALATGRPQVALLDLDGFKTVNDRLGHSVGDRLLSELARRITAGLATASVAGEMTHHVEGTQRLRHLIGASGAGRQATARPANTVVVARMGGDEFAVLLPSATAAEADAVVDWLGEALRRPIPAGEHELLIGASIGVADGTGTDDPFEVLRRADVAMYAAKESGERSHRYATELDAAASEQARIGAELRTALDAGQFRLVYQPIVTLPDGELAAVETLVRWDHPERGFVSPADFIPVAERNGLIVELGAWILRSACLQAAQWRAEYGPDALQRISVNVSARQLAEPGLVEVVASALAASGLPSTCLTIEVTETAVFDSARAVDVLNELHALGVRIALDDFGTGQSSLSLLQTLPADVLKVDKSFVDNITKAGRHAVIATALIQVAGGLGLTAVAEGVETAEQAAELHRLGYRFAQGYYFGRPVAEPELIRGKVPVGAL